MTRWNRLNEVATTLEVLCWQGTIWLARGEPLRCSWSGRLYGWERPSEAIMMDALGVSSHPCCDDVMASIDDQKSARRALSAPAITTGTPTTTRRMRQVCP